MEMDRSGKEDTDLETFVLQDLLDGDVFAFFWRANEFCLKNDTERTISDDFAVGVGEVSSLA